MGRKLLIAAVVAVTLVNFWLVSPVGGTAGVSPRFDWPDETANYFWIKHFSETGNLVAPEPLNEQAANQIHPRSFNVRTDGALVPGSFLGLILLYGVLVKVFTMAAVPYFTPILGAFGIMAFYGIIRKLFNNRIAVVAATIALIHPAWWYYSATSMLPNVPFVSLLTIGLYLLIRQNEHRRKLGRQYLIAGAFVGTALAIRPSEIIWVGALMLVIVLYRRSTMRPMALIFLIIGLIIAIAPSLYYQQQIYGDALVSGYNQLDEQASTACTSCQIVHSIILPFGFHPALIVSNMWAHLLSRLWWLSLLATLGGIAYLVRPQRHREEMFGYLMVSLFLGAWLAIFYGSWEFSDQLTVSLNTLGLSYVRYWLPLYLLSTPYIAFGLVWLTSLFKERYRKVALIILVAALVYPSAQLVLFQKPDSIVPVRERVRGYASVAHEVNQLTETDSVIITVRKDKVFFPERRVIHTFDALSQNNELAGIVSNLRDADVPVYYYALGPEPITELTHGVLIEQVKTFGQEILYKLK